MRHSPGRHGLLIEDQLFATRLLAYPQLMCGSVLLMLDDQGRWGIRL
jgi:hypothetical protein